MLPKQQIATQPYTLRYLTDDEGLALLFRNAFQQHVEPENYPHHLLDVAKRLTKKCGGLPLALVVLGGILTRKDRNYIAWNMLDGTIDWHGKDGKECSQVLAKSFEDLPQYLKDCFLYFAAFPEDYKISGEHVTRMWMAEDFIAKDGSGTIDDRAEECLEELVQRCLIQVTKKSWSSYCKYCSMHDLLRDLAIRKGKDENFFTVFSKEEDVNNLATIKPRRAALKFCTPTKDGIYSENTSSLLCFGFEKRSSNDNGFGLLRVLTFESVDMTTFTRRQWLKGMIHLRYLRLRNCNIPQGIFKEISFYDLETIDLNGSEVHKKANETLDLCDVINPSSGSLNFNLKLHYQRLADEMVEFCDVVFPSLRHVSGSQSFRLPLKWDKHTNLQTIMNVRIQIESVIELGFCINLRTLVIHIESAWDSERVIKGWKNLKSVLRRTEQLVYLNIRTYGLLPFGGTKDLTCHGKIQKLVMLGEWVCVPSVEMFPTNLTKLELKYTKLLEDPMPILERLQTLRILYLYGHSYMGTELICSTGGFPNLEKLKLRGLRNLHYWEIKEGAMHILCYLDIYTCDKLHVLPELQNVQTLQELTVYNPSRELWEGMQMQGKDVHKIKHIPSVCIRD